MGLWFILLPGTIAPQLTSGYIAKGLDSGDNRDEIG